jgi:acid phosphatase (class A)
VGENVSFVRRKPGLAAYAAFVLLVGAGAFWLAQHPSHYLTADPRTFAAIFAPPPAQDSAQTRAELDELLTLQAARTDAEAAAAQDDKHKDVSRFYAALGFPRDSHPALPKLDALMNRVENDIGPYVRAPKQRFQRMRPYVIEPKLHPCIGGVRDDESYPSGHATYGYVMGYLLSDMVPERRTMLAARADEFGRQRMMCGVHFRSDVAAGREGALWLVHALEQNALYRRDALAARDELRAALGLPRVDAPGPAVESAAH